MTRPELPDGALYIPEGEYTFRIISIAQKTSTVTGRDFAMLRCMVIWSPYEGAIIHRPVLPGSEEKGSWVWEACLVDPLDPRSIGVVFTAKVGYEERKGVTRAHMSGRMNPYYAR